MRESVYVLTSVLVVRSVCRFRRLSINLFFNTDMVYFRIF